MSALQRQGEESVNYFALRLVSLLVACKTMTTVLLPAVWLRQILIRKLTLKLCNTIKNSFEKLKYLDID